MNLPTSSYGKIVMKKYVELQESAGPVVNCQPIKIPVGAPRRNDSINGGYQQADGAVFTRIFQGRYAISNNRGNS